MRRFASVVLATTMAGSTTAAATFTVTTIADSGAGSLRQAILDANANFGDDDIAFSIPESGVHTIVLGSALPAIAHPVTIDGYTQPGSSPNSNPPGQGNNAVLTIEIDGTAVGSNPCLTVNAGNASALTMIVDGLAINRCPNVAILVGTGGDGALIVGNFIGTDPAGNSRPGLQGGGVAILGAQNVSVRGNLVSGNDAYGISINTGGDGSAVTGNLIGTNAAGTAPIPGVPVDAGGVIVFGSANVTIGGPSTADRNVISGLPGDGITVDGSTVIQANYIQGNYIGTDVTGTHALGNIPGGITASASTLIIKGNVIAAKDGGIIAFGSVLIIQGNFIGTDETATIDFGISGSAIAITLVNTVNCTIGGAAPGEGNVLAHNFFGIVVDNSTGARIRGNRIFDNKFLGIDLGGDGVTQNDAGDADGGANNLQNYPMITSVAPGASTTHIAGSLNSTVSTAFDIDLFSSPACQFRPQSYLEAEAYLGSLQVTTDSSGNASFEIDVPLVLAAGQPVTATATDPAGNSSELSQRILLSMNPPSGAPEGGDELDSDRNALRAGDHSHGGRCCCHERQLHRPDVDRRDHAPPPAGLGERRHRSRSKRTDRNAAQRLGLGLPGRAGRTAVS